MYPVLFRIGSFEVMSFGLMVAAGALAGVWIFGRELRLRGLPRDAVNGAIAGLIAGLIGAKLLYVAEHLGEDPFFSLLFSRGGLSWFGGLFGGVFGALAYFRVRRWPLLPLVSTATPALAVGHLLGRIGCFLVGDDYGRPTSLPWGVAFPDGSPPTDVPVHPTQLYEAALLGILAWLLFRWRRAGLSDRQVVGWYLLLTGVIRFAIEFLRVNLRVALGLTVAQYGALCLIFGGLLLLVATSARQKAV
ncbi:MAG TPA: prolipoprotein diacylglyceryl transferase [Bryobacteraceae bacterium]|nr:prolipoprotein diacylglyceryl transferase [Bryobacteraceae bacterium]